jgi:hypothetical protein
MVQETIIQPSGVGFAKSSPKKECTMFFNLTTDFLR